MAGRFSRKRVFPVLLENAAQTIDAAGAKDWNKDTSSVKIDVDGDVTLNLAEPLENGTLVIVEITQAGFTSTNSVDIKDAENSTTVVSLNGTNESATLMWNAEEWKLIANESASGTVTGVNGSFSGTLAVTGAATLSDDLTVAGASALNGHVDIGNAITDTVGFYGVTKVAQQAEAAQAATDVGAISNFPADGDGSTDEIEAIADAVRSLETLLNEVRQSLVDLGLIKGGAA